MKNHNHRSTTKDSYYQTWKAFNKFLIKLDRILKSWEHKVAIYCAYLVECKKLQSSTIKSYVSGIKAILTADGYLWNDRLLLLTTITRACKLKNDRLLNRFPVQTGLLNLLLSQLEIKFRKQCYLECLYKVVYSLAYYGLFRIGELTQSPHVIKARNVHLAQEKNQFQFILYSSKTHSTSDRPQKIVIKELTTSTNHRIKHYCPFQITQFYVSIRPPACNASEQFLVYSDGTPLTAADVRKTLRSIMTSLGLDGNNYDTHSFRIGRATDLIKIG